MCLVRAWPSIWIPMGWGFQWEKSGEAASVKASCD
jgi:hypothetical protein